MLISNTVGMVKKTGSATSLYPSDNLIRQSYPKTMHILKPNKLESYLSTSKQYVMLAETSCAKAIFEAALMIRALVEAFGVGPEPHLFALRIMQRMIKSKVQLQDWAKEISASVFIYSCWIMRKGYLVTAQYVYEGLGELDIKGVSTWMKMIFRNEGSGINLTQIYRQKHKARTIARIERSILRQVRVEVNNLWKRHKIDLIRFSTEPRN